jgi:hypothetical protein
MLASVEVEHSMKQNFSQGTCTPKCNDSHAPHHKHLQKLSWKCPPGGNGILALTVNPRVRVLFPLGSIPSQDNQAGRGNISTGTHSKDPSLTQDVQWDRQPDYCDPSCRKRPRIPVEMTFSPMSQNDCWNDVRWRPSHINRRTDHESTQRIWITHNTTVGPW